MTAHKALRGMSMRWSHTATLLLMISFVYVVVLGTQFKMMSILGAHHETAHSSPGGGGHHVGSLPSIKRGKAAKIANAKRLERPGQENQRRALSQLKTTLDWSSPTPDQLRQYKAMSSSIAGKWNLTTPNAAELLKQQFLKVNDYDPDGDFLHFHHLYKSGGTSISNLMDQTIGLPRLADGRYEGILPGSLESGNFDHEVALADIKQVTAVSGRTGLSVVAGASDFSRAANHCFSASQFDNPAAAPGGDGAGGPALPGVVRAHRAAARLRPHADADGRLLPRAPPTP